MKRTPSVCAILKAFPQLTKDQATRMKIAMQCNIGLRVANNMLKGFGIESIGLPDGCFNNCQEPEVDIRYVNMGDTYSTTLMKVNGQYRIGCWGDVVEQYER